MKIAKITAREIYNSAGWPTIECQIFLDNGQSVKASVPAGTSTSNYEAIDLRDGGSRLLGKGVQRAIENIEQIIAPVLTGQELQILDMDSKIIELDGTPNKSRLGANATLAVSMALYRAGALVSGVELFEFIAYMLGADTVNIPIPMLNFINGGMHANNNLQIQEFLIMPVGATSFRYAFEVAATLYQELRESLLLKNKSVAVGQEGGFAGDFKNEFEALDILVEVIEKVQKTTTVNCVIGLDVAASTFFDVDTQLYNWNNKKLVSDEMIELYMQLVSKYPIYSIEDGLSEDDWQGWVKMTKALENKAQIIGDDLFATDISRISIGAQEHAATGVIIKPNQIGTITETLQAIQLSKSQQLITVVSHRSQETCDSFISDLAVGTSVTQIKAGACARSERLAKYNRLLTIEDDLSLEALKI